MTVISELEANIGYNNSKTLDFNLSDIISVPGNIVNGYFKLREFEKSGQFYERLGVKHFMKAYDFLITKHIMGAVSYLTKTDEHFLNGHSHNELKSVDNFGKVYETMHFFFNALTLPEIISNFQQGDIRQATYSTIGTLIVNIYPIMMQRYKRARINKVLEHREARDSK